MNDEKKEDKRKREPEGEASPEVKPEQPAAREKKEDPLEKTRRERDEYLDLLQRTRAEFSNYRKRTERERADMCSFAVGDFVKALLPVLDDLERAVRSAKDTGDLQGALAGVRIVADHLSKVLADHGVSAISPQGERFDPQYHHAVLMAPHPELQPGTVSEVMHKGYVMKDRVLRPASVKVVSAPPPAEPVAESDDSGPGGPEVSCEDADQE